MKTLNIRKIERLLNILDKLHYSVSNCWKIDNYELHLTKLKNKYVYIIRDTVAYHNDYFVNLSRCLNNLIDHKANDWNDATSYISLCKFFLIKHRFTEFFKNKI